MTQCCIFHDVSFSHNHQRQYERTSCIFCPGYIQENQHYLCLYVTLPFILSTDLYCIENNFVLVITDFLFDMIALTVIFNTLIQWNFPFNVHSGFASFNVLFQRSVIIIVPFKCSVLLHSVLKCTVSQRNIKWTSLYMAFFKNPDLSDIFLLLSARPCNQWWLRLILDGYCKCSIPRIYNPMTQSLPQKQIVHLVKKFIGSTNSANLSVI